MAGQQYIVVPIYCTINYLLYNIIKFIVKQNQIVYIYYCKKFHDIFTIYCEPPYPHSVNIKALQSQIFNITNVKTILSTQPRQKSKWKRKYVGHSTTSAAIVMNF